MAVAESRLVLPTKVRIPPGVIGQTTRCDVSFLIGESLGNKQVHVTASRVNNGQHLNDLVPDVVGDDIWAEDQLTAPSHSARPANARLVGKTIDSSEYPIL